jgi:hypothetical protein
MHARFASTVIFALGLTTACSNGAGLPTSAVEEPGKWLQAELQSPNADDGAVLFRITGKGITAVEGIGLSPTVQMQGTTSATVMLTGEIASGALVRIKVPETALDIDYSGVVLQAAERDTYRQQSVQEYQLSFRAVP